MRKANKPNEEKASGGIDKLFSIVGFLGEIYTRSNEGRAEQEQKRRNERALVRATRQTGTATIVIAIFGILTFGAAVIQAIIFNRQLTVFESTDKTANDTLVASNRAWLAVEATKLTKPLDAADGPEVTISVNNVGRSPALDVRIGGTWNVMPANKPDNSQAFSFPSSPLWAILDAQIRNQCSGVAPLDGGETIFPLGLGEHSALASPNPKPSLQKVIDQNGEILIAPGCLTYRSFEEPRHTGFCRYALRENGEWAFGNCPVGNFAK